MPRSRLPDVLKGAFGADGVCRTVAMGAFGAKRVHSECAAFVSNAPVRRVAPGHLRLPRLNYSRRYPDGPGLTESHLAGHPTRNSRMPGADNSRRFRTRSCTPSWSRTGLCTP